MLNGEAHHFDAGVDPDLVLTVWLGDAAAADLSSDLNLSAGLPKAEAAEQIKSLLRDRGVIFRPS